MADNFTYSKFPDVSPKPYSAYASQTVTVSGETLDYSLKDNTSLFSSLSSPIEVEIRNVTENISIKFNDAANDSILILQDLEFATAGIIVSDILVTVSGSSDASLSVYTLGWR